MKSFQFTVCVTDDEGYNIEIKGLLTPIVKADSFAEALKDKAIIDFCADNKCTVYKQVGR